MNYIHRLRVTEAALEAAWAAQHGPWPERKPREPRPWPPHVKPPCFDCWYAEKYRAADAGTPVEVENVRGATTWYEGDQGTVLLCERHWRKRYRDYGYTDAEIRAVLVLVGNFSEAEADAMLAEDAAPGSAPGEVTPCV